MNAVDLWKRWVPRSYQQRVIEARLAARRRTDPRRPLPDFLVIGAQRCGTSSIYKYLEQHPCVLSSLRKETEYFSARWANGEGWYRAHFPSEARKGQVARRKGHAVSFEATPYYLFHPLAPARAAALVPDVRLIILLRNPVDRAYSHYRHSVRRGFERLSFEEAVAAEARRLAGEADRIAADPRYDGWNHRVFSYLTRGAYVDQLLNWLGHFPAEQLLVVRSEELYADPARCYRDVLAFLGLSSWEPRRFDVHAGYAAPAAIGPDLRRRLSEQFRPQNRRLEELLGRSMGWDG